MMARIFFCAENVLVSSDAVTVGRCAFPLNEVRGVRSRRVRLWVWDSYEVILSHRLLREVSLLRHRNAYFVFQLVGAIEAALDARQKRGTLEEALSA